MKQSCNKNILLMLLCCVSCTQAFAENSGASTTDLIKYDIELIIFEDANARYINTERWPVKEEASDGAGTSDVAEGGNKSEVSTEDESVKVIEDITSLDKLSLSEIESIDQPEEDVLELTEFMDIEPSTLLEQHKKNNSSAEYNVLYYASWRQHGLDEKNAFDIDINILANASEALLEEDNTQSSNKIAKNTTADETAGLDSALEAKDYISGNVKIVLARYLHFYSELSYQRKLDGEALDVEEKELSEASHNGQIEDANLVANPKLVGAEQIVAALPVVEYQAYPVTAHRRMRSKELHYIDHPSVGILIQINPAPEPVEDDADSVVE